MASEAYKFIVNLYYMDKLTVDEVVLSTVCMFCTTSDVEEALPLLEELDPGISTWLLESVSLRTDVFEIPIEAQKAIGRWRGYRVRPYQEEFNKSDQDSLPKEPVQEYYWECQFCGISRYLRSFEVPGGNMCEECQK